MKIYVSQGHEKGIGLEVFFKSCLLLSQNELSKLTLIAFKKSVESTLRSLKVPFKLSKDRIQLAHIEMSVQWLEKHAISQSFTALNLGMKLAESGGILFTLPTSKDQLDGHAGHTEYFRHFYRAKDLGMFFLSPALKVLLITDHVAVSMLSKIVTKERIAAIVSTAQRTLNEWGIASPRFLISGLNPHAGEGGIIGSEDTRVSQAIKQISDKKSFAVSGPFPGDTMLLERKSTDDVLVYLFHDQALGIFKGLQGFIGANVTLGLPYPRFSPDHGTSFGLFGKNAADYRGCKYALEQALELRNRIANGQDSSHKSKSS